MTGLERRRGRGSALSFAGPDRTTDAQKRLGIDRPITSRPGGHQVPRHGGVACAQSRLVWVELGSVATAHAAQQHYASTIVVGRLAAAPPASQWLQRSHRLP